LGNPALAQVLHSTIPLLTQNTDSLGYDCSLQSQLKFDLRHPIITGLDFRKLQSF